LLLKSASQVSSGPLLPSSARRCEKRPSGGAAFAGYDDRAASNGFFHPGILSRLNYCYAFPLLSCQGATSKSSSTKAETFLNCRRGNPLGFLGDPRLVSAGLPGESEGFLGRQTYLRRKPSLIVAGEIR